MSDKPYLVKCLKAIGISGEPHAKDAEVYVSEKDARELVIRKRVIALNFHIDWKRDSRTVIVNEGVTKNQAIKIEEFKEKEAKNEKVKSEKSKDLTKV